MTIEELKHIVLNLEDITSRAAKMFKHFAETLDDDMTAESLIKDWEAYVIEDWAPRFKGQTVTINELQNELLKRNFKPVPGRRKIRALADKYPEVLSIGNTAGNVWKVKIAT